MGSIGSASQQTFTRTERLVNLIADEIIGGWVEDSYIDDDEKESILNWHDLLEHINMTAQEAKESIIDDLFYRAGTWDFSSRRDIPEEDRKLVFLDNEFEDENGDYIKYGAIMKLVKQRLAEKGFMQRGN